MKDMKCRFEMLKLWSSSTVFLCVDVLVLLSSCGIGDHGKKSSLCSSSTAFTTIPALNVSLSSQSNSSQAPPDLCQENKQFKSYHLITKCLEPESVQYICGMGGLQERRCLRFISRFPADTQSHSVVVRLLRKLKVHHRKQIVGIPIFDIDYLVEQSIRNVQKYAADIERNSHALPNNLSLSRNTLPPSDDSQPSSAAIVHAKQVLDKIYLFPTLCFPAPVRFTSLLDMFCGGKGIFQTFANPYTSKLLKPLIFRSMEFSPSKVRVLKEICRQGDGIHSPMFQSKRVDFCYFQKHFLSAVNNFISYFFWPVDMNEYLQYPDFSVVVLYGKLLVGCAFMTPNVQVSEAYIPFLLVHPDFRRCGIAKIMLYHLIQSCQGKDITLHVSVDNPAMLLYQQFGFEVELICLNFYDRYYPSTFCFSKHAFFMRLR